MTYSPKDIQLQAFCGDSCTTWLPDCEKLLEGTPLQIADRLRRLVAEQVEIANRPEFKDRPLLAEPADSLTEVDMVRILGTINRGGRCLSCGADWRPLPNPDDGETLVHSDFCQYTRRLGS